jgi:hypothetical protein
MQAWQKLSGIKGISPAGRFLVNYFPIKPHLPVTLHATRLPTL